MCNVMTSLIEANRSTEKKIFQNCYAQVDKIMEHSRDDKLSLKRRYEVAAKGLTHQLHALKLMYLSNTWRNLTPTSPAPSSPQSAMSTLSINAQEFQPGMTSSSSSDSDSDMRSDGSTVSSSTIDIMSPRPPIPRMPVKVKKDVPRLAVVGKTITGRLNIYKPVNAKTKYYINWCNRTHDNLLMDEEVMKNVFGTLDALKVGTWFRVKITHVPDHPKEHPKGNHAVCVPCPKGRKNHRRKSRRRRPTQKLVKIDTATAL